MTLIERAFELYLSRITPPPSQMNAAQRSHNALRSFLGRDDYFGTMIVATFLNGSYARKTVIRPINDVDIIVVVGAEWIEVPPANAMESLRRKLAQRYPERRTLRQRRAVRVTLYDMQLDVLLAVGKDGDSRPLRIPDRNVDRWIQTHPKTQLALTQRLGKRTRGNYVRLVRLVKSWAAARVAAQDRPSSFVLECAAYHIVAQQPAAFRSQLGEGFIALLEGLYSWDFGRANQWLFRGRPEVADPALPNSNVAEEWDAEGADRFRQRLALALKRCADLDRSRWEETEVGKWQVIFGEPFPGARATARWRG